MATDIGWCWIGIIPELLVIEPERFKTPKVVNKEYNKKGIADCPAYQGFYNNIFILKSPVSFTAIPLEGRVEIDSPEIDEPELQKLFVETLISDSETYSRCQNILSHTYFEQPFMDCVQFIKK